jgi:hypothetical protein
MTSAEARNELIRNHGWAGTTVDIWMQANGCCEYCGVNLLSSSDRYFDGSHIDHIVPDGSNDPDNFALACVACNRIKRRFDPSRKDAPSQTRKELLDAARSYILQRRERDAGRLRAAAPLLRDCGIRAPIMCGAADVTLDQNE